VNAPDRGTNGNRRRDPAEQLELTSVVEQFREQVQNLG